MDWDKDKSVKLTRACVAVCAVLLAVLDIGAYRFAFWYVQVRLAHRQLGVLLMVTIYSGSVFAWVCLRQLWRLLENIRRGEVFVPANVKCMRTVSWCCVWAAVICALSTLYYPPFGFVAFAAGFMALIVRIVKNAFQQAAAMKDELDLTV